MDHALVIKVLHAVAVVASDTDAAQDISCHLVTEGWRVATRPKRRADPRGRVAWDEAFLLGASQLEGLAAGIGFELLVAKRWGGDALVAQGVLGLEAFSMVPPGGQPVALALPLVAPAKALPRSASRGAAAAAAAAPAPAQPLLEVGSLVLELRLVAPPPPPPVPPAVAAEPPTIQAAAASGATPGAVATSVGAELLVQCSVLHTLPGEVYEVPPGQVLRLLVRRCQGLHALHLEPTGASPRASLASFTASGGGSRLGWGAASRGARGSSGAGSEGSTGGVSDFGDGPLRATSSALLNRTGQWLRRASTAARGARGAGPPPAHGADESTPDTEVELASLLPPPAAHVGADAAADAEHPGSEPPCPEEEGAATPAGGEPRDRAPPAASGAVAPPSTSPPLEASAPPAHGAAPDMAHARTTSVDYGSVMSALEDLGFHATDAPGGIYGAGLWFYVKVYLDGWEGVTRMSPLSSDDAGTAAWGDAFCVALPRPASANAALVLELYASPDKKQRGRCVCRVEEPLSRVFEALEPRRVLKGAPPLLAASLKLLGALPRRACTFYLEVELADTDGRADARGLPRASLMSHPLARTTSAAGAARGGGAGGGEGTMRQPGEQANATPSWPPEQPPPLGAQPASAAPPHTTPPATPTAGAPAAAPSPPAPAGSLPWDEPHTLGALDLVVDGFTLAKPADCFCVVQLGPYWAVSTTVHSSAKPQWGWQLRLAVTDPATVLTLALFRRDDQSGGKKVMSLTRMFGEGVSLIAKLRVRLSTLCPDMPLSVQLPMAGERSNLRSGQVGAATAQLRMHLRVPRLLGAWLPAYAQTLTPPAVLLLSRAGDAGSTPEAIDAAVFRVAGRWLEEQSPGLPPRVARRVVDDGRQEFTLSRTRHNWRRVLALRGAVAPAAALFDRVVAWEEPLLSGGVVSAILLGGLYPSHALAALLLAAAAHMLRGRARTYRATWALPPPMEPDIAAPEDAGVGVPPTDPYSALKANFDTVMEFTTAVQNVLDGWAASGERLQALLTWQDPVASAAFTALLVAGAVALLAVGVRGLITIGLLWLVRPPPLRDPFPPPPANFIARLPTRGDVCL